jgi:hypothetical protein
MAAGSGYTATADVSIVNTTIGAGSGYSSPTTNLYVICCTNNFTAATKALSTAVEWLVSSDTNYTRQAMGASGGGWTVAAYVNSTGVVFKNTNTITQPAVAGANQTLGAIGFNDAAGPTGGNTNFFIDLATPQAVNIGVQVILAAASPGPAGVSFTLY